MRRIVVPSSKNQLNLFDTLEKPRGLVRIDAEPIRQQWIRRYYLFEKKLEKVKKEWRLFEQESIPLYQKWYYSTFANELARNNDWNEKAREQEMIITAISAHRNVYGIPEMEAYARVKHRLHKKQDPFPDAEDLERYRQKIREREEAEQKRREALRERRFAEAKRRQEEMAKNFWDSAEEQQAYAEEIDAAAQDWFSKNAAKNGYSTSDSIDDSDSPPKQNHSRPDDLKTLYRKIVRALHPDSGHEMTPIEKDWWHQAQDAYRMRDLHTLRTIALKIHAEEEVPIEQIEHISTLIELCASLLEQQDQIEQEKRHLRKDPIYRFWSSRSRPQNREKLEMELAAQLNFQFRRIKDFVEQVKDSFRAMERLMRGEGMNEEGGGGRGRGRGRSRDR